MHKRNICCVAKIKSRAGILNWEYAVQLGWVTSMQKRSFLHYVKIFVKIGYMTNFKCEFLSKHNLSNLNTKQSLRLLLNSAIGSLWWNLNVLTSGEEMTLLRKNIWVSWLKWALFFPFFFSFWKNHFRVDHIKDTWPILRKVLSKCETIRGDSFSRSDGRNTIVLPESSMQCCDDLKKKLGRQCLIFSWKYYFWAAKHPFFNIKLDVGFPKAKNDFPIPKYFVFMDPT